MKPVFRDVPDDQNGYLQIINFAENLKEPLLPVNIESMQNGDSPWDATQFNAWLAENQEAFDTILRIAELPDQSSKEVSLDRLASGTSRHSSDLGFILRSAARVAFESGDQELALRAMKASTALADHLIDIETPTLLGEVMSVGIRVDARDSFRENFLPALANDPVALEIWKKAIFRDETASEEYSRIMIGEWNSLMRHTCLPALLGYPMLGEERFSVSNVDGFIDAVTARFVKSSDGILDLGADRFDVANSQLEMADPTLHTAPSGIVAQTLAVYRGISRSIGVPVKAPAGTVAQTLAVYRGITRAMGFQVTATAMNSAAISILLGEAPPVDPVSGKPFSWDPKTRLLSAPEGGSEIDPIQVP